MYNTKENPEVRFYSSNTAVAKADETGKVTAVANGKCIIYGITLNGMIDTVEVEVEE